MIKIDIDTRCWKIPKEECFLGVESDDKVKILQFELSKNEFCDGLNFTDCNCFINYKNEGNDTIPYAITDMEVKEDGTVTFTWKVSRGATIFKGNTFAILCAKKISEDGTITNEWNSRIGSFTVAKGIEPLSSIAEVPEIDIISQLLLVAKQTNANAQTNIDKSSSLLEKAEGLGYLKEEYDVLEARMNQFTSLQEGSTTGDAELIDGRIGYDGKVYDNIGGAIREQVSELKGDLGKLNDIFAYADNMQISQVQMKRYDIENGKLITLEGSSYNSFKSSIIDVTDGDVYLYSGRVYNYEKQWSIIVTDGTDNVLFSALNITTDKSVTDYEFHIPNGGRKLYLQSYITPIVLKRREFIDVVSEIKENADNIALNSSEIKIPTYDKVLRSISRLGGINAPKNCKQGFINAYNMGFRILLCDIRFTSDNVPVLFHDNYINQNYRDVYDSNGVMVPRDSQIDVASITSETFLSYKYKKTIDGSANWYPTMSLEEMCKLIKSLPVELYIEIKSMTEEQASIACNIVKKYGISSRTSWVADSASIIGYVKNNIPQARIGTMPSTINSTQVGYISALKTSENNVFIFGWNTTVLTDANVKLMMDANIPFEIGTIDTEQGILDYFAQGNQYNYCTGIESNSVIAGKVILEKSVL